MSFSEYARAQLAQSQMALAAAAENGPFLEQLESVCSAITGCFQAGGKVLLAETAAVPLMRNILRRNSSPG